MKALLVIDMQNDFMPGGSLGIPGASEIIEPIVKLMPTFSHCIATQDWHPLHHCSFAASHPGKRVGDTVVIEGRPQRLWPIHCVQNTWGAELAPGFSKDQFEAVFHKGTNPSIDGYSGFYDNAHLQSTGLTFYLKSHHITQVTIVGVAFDYCVLYSALDARRDGFEVEVRIDLCPAIDASAEGIRKVMDQMEVAGIEIC